MGREITKITKTAGLQKTDELAPGNAKKPAEHGMAGLEPPTQKKPEGQSWHVCDVDSTKPGRQPVTCTESTAQFGNPYKLNPLCS